MKTSIVTHTLFQACVLITTNTGAIVLSPPSITGGSTPFNPDWAQSNVFDGTTSAYASLGAGDNTYLTFDFGSNVQFDRVIMLNRISDGAGDRFTQVVLEHAAAGQPTTQTTISSTDARAGMSRIYSMNGQVTAQTVIWNVDTRNGTVFNNTGLQEMYFLNTPDNANIISGVSAYNAATAFSGGYNATQAIDGFIGGSSTDYIAEYASSGLGVGMFIDFDLGTETEVVGFDYLDRLTASDNVEKFDLIFSNDPNFGTTVETKSYDKGSSSAFSDEFSAVSARYVRLDATQVYSGTGATFNSGANEILFYESIPEPSSVVLLISCPIGLFAIRRFFCI